MSVINLTLRTPTGVVNPLLDRVSQRSNGDQLKKLRDLITAFVSGGGFPGRQGNSGVGSREVASLEYMTDFARANITAASVAGADTATLNGQALTATQHRATGTVTMASVLAADTFTLNGVVFTAVTGAPVGNQFDRTPGTDTTTAASLVAAINGVLPSAVGVYGLIKARNAAGVVTLYAVTGGTAGNAFTLVSSNGGRLAVSGATMASGAAVANNQFDFVGTDITTARALADCINNSTTAAINAHVKASCRRAIVTCASVLHGDYVEVDGTRLICTAELTDSAGARITTFADNYWSKATTDTTAAVALVNCINAHPRLRDRFFAINAAGVVSLYERWPEATAAPSIGSNNATRLALSGGVGGGGGINGDGRFADAALVLVQAKEPGPGGNAKTVVTSNGGRLAITNDASGKLTGGASTVITI